jgi:hypothetical protein
MLAYAGICVETTGASGEILDDLLSLTPAGKTVVARASAPLRVDLASDNAQFTEVRIVELFEGALIGA